MDLNEKKKFDDSFDKYAQSYDEIRPKYPKEIYETIFKLIGEETKILEVGSGSGIATKELAKSKAQIYAVEPGENLHAISKVKLKDFDNVHCICDTFENIKLEENEFDAIIAATAFHWLKGENELEKFYRSSQFLKKDGYLILFWNSFCRLENDLTKEMDKIYEEELSSIYKKESDINLKVLQKVIDREKEMVNNNYFYIDLITRYKNLYTYSGEQYIDLLNTYPEIVGLDDEVKTRFFDRVLETISKFNNEIKVPVLASLYILKKKENFSDDFIN